MIGNIRALFRLTLYLIITFLIFILCVIWRIIPIPPKHIRQFGWYLYSEILNIKFRIIGNEKLSSKRPLLLIANHTSFLEFIMFGRFFNPTFVSKKEFEKTPILSTMIKAAGSMFISRNPKDAKTATEELAKKLNN